jgi:flagellar motor switch protein FliM
MSASEQGTRKAVIQACNFRYAGRLSNENTRTLNTLNERFAVNVASALEIYLGTSLQIRLVSLEQIQAQDYISKVRPNAYLMKCALKVMEGSALVEIGEPLVFPIIDLLLGGSGAVSGEERELTDIDEEMLGNVLVPVVQQLERAWKVLDVALAPGPCVKPTMISQVFGATEKLVVFMFEVSLGDAKDLLKVVLPTPFVGYLLRQLTAVRSKKAATFNQERPTLRERILDCNFTLSADIVEMKVMVKDLIALKPGMHLKMNAPVSRPGSVTIESVEIFNSAPVRNGKQKATQLLGRANAAAAAREWA